MAKVTHPLFAFALYFVFIPFTHLTSLMNLMMTHMWIHDLEQIGFFVVGYLFFRVAFGLERGFKLHPGLRLVYVMAAVPVDTFTGLVLSNSSRVPYSNYAMMAPRGSTAVWRCRDIKLGGGIMWIGGDALMLLASFPIAIMWVRWETMPNEETRRDPRRAGDLNYNSPAAIPSSSRSFSGRAPKWVDDLSGAQGSELGRLDRVGAQSQPVEKTRGEHVARAVLVDDVLDLHGGDTDHARHGRHVGTVVAPASRRPARPTRRGRRRLAPECSN